jgi:DNA-binding transcriptional ArsR family regulator
MENLMKLDFKFPEWEPQYKAALLEVDRAKLLERVAAAEAAIRQRMRAIFSRTDGDMEWQAIGRALSALSVLKEAPLS